jgi:hypothetical protein
MRHSRNGTIGPLDTASSIDFTFQGQKPASSSLVSATEQRNRGHSFIPQQFPVKMDSL